MIHKYGNFYYVGTPRELTERLNVLLWMRTSECMMDIWAAKLAWSGRKEVYDPMDRLWELMVSGGAVPTEAPR